MFKPGQILICVESFYHDEYCISLEKGKEYTFSHYTNKGRGVALKEFPHVLRGFWPHRFRKPSEYFVDSVLKMITEDADTTSA